MGAYRGEERRRHRVYRTRNTEYHVRDEICVAVRDRNTERWLSGHLALKRRVEGGVRIHPNGARVPSLLDPKPGDAIFFSYDTPEGDDRQIVTSRVEWIGRPAKSVVASYPRLR